MKAIILAAGFGKRMRPLTHRTHKTLLDVGGRKVIQWIVDALVEHNVTELVVVTGYRAGELREYLSEAYPKLDITYVHNERYAHTNNIYSMALALNSVPIDTDFLLIECDLIFEPAVIGRLLSSRHQNVALVDRYRRGMDGTVVTVTDGRITEVIVPQRQGAGFTFDDKYKTLNLYRFSRDFCAGSFKKLLDYYSAVISDNDYYEMVLGIIIYLQSEAIHAEIIDREKWTEIDDPNDIEVARYMFDPRSRRKMLAESHGAYWNYDVVDFAFLRNMYFPTGAVYSELRNSLPVLMQNYGSAQRLVDRKLSYYLWCSPERLTVLNGASQAYPVLGRLFEDNRVLLPEPTFGEYSRIFPAASHYCDRPGFHMEEIARIAPGRELVVFVNPNNPTGTVLPTRAIYDFAAAHPQTTVLCDESFLDYSAEPSLLPLLEQAPLDNVILLKSLSKSLGVPGLRLGYVYTTHALFQEQLRTALPIWNLNSFAEHFLELILKHRPEIEASFQRTAEDREALRTQLSAVPVVDQVWPSGGNYLLVSLRGGKPAADALAEALVIERGIHVKDVSDRFSGDGGYWRLAVRTPEENAALVAALAGSV